MKKIIKIPYGKTYLNCKIDSKNLLGVLTKEDRQLKVNAADFIGYKLNHPLNGVRLEDFITKNDKAMIVVPDLTRYAYVDKILPLLLKYLLDIGLSKNKIGVLVANGLHRALSTKELIELVGQYAYKNFKVFNHTQESSKLVSLAMAKHKVLISLNKMLLEADSVISIGVVEPHLYAGYSGGAKTVAIGCAGRQTIDTTHGPRFLDNPNTKLGKVIDNPFQEVLKDIASKVPIKFCINVICDDKGGLVELLSGRLDDVHKTALIRADKFFRVGVGQKADIVVCGIGYPKDINLYQASRAINYILNVDKPILKKGGIIILAASMDEGFGRGSGEIIFKKTLENAKSMIALAKAIKSKGCVAGAHRAYMVARVSGQAKIIFVTRNIPDFKNNNAFLFFDNLDKALKYALHLKGNKAKAYIIPKALSLITSVGKNY